MYFYVIQKEVMKDGSRPKAIQEVEGVQGDAYMVLHQIMAYDWANTDCLKSDVVVTDEYLTPIKTDCFDRTPEPVETEE